MFSILIFITAFCMEAIGTYISVYGLSALFAGDPVIIIMAAILDIAKVVSVSFLYQQWGYMNRVMRYYMTFAVIILMTITSAGTFGYLSASFQKAIQPTSQTSLKEDSYTQEINSLNSEKIQLSKQQSDIDSQISQLPSNNVRGRRQLIYSFKPEEDRIRSRIVVITKHLDELNSGMLIIKNNSLENEVHVGPIIYIAKTFDISIEQASKWIILIIMFIFDPLAIILIIAGNFLVLKKKSEYIDKNKVVDIHNISEKSLQTSILKDLNLDKEDFILQKNSNEVIYEDSIVKKTEVKDKKEDPRQEVFYENSNEKIEDTSIDIQDIKLKDESLIINNLEISNILDLVYNDVARGERGDTNEEDNSNDVLFLKTIKDYIPSIPASQNLIEVDGDMNFIGSPQTNFIDNQEILESSLDALKINMPDALLRQGQKTTSTKLHLYKK